MSLINCQECGKENVSDTAVSCPNCGYTIKSHFEKINNEERKAKQEPSIGNSISDYIKGHKVLVICLSFLVVIILFFIIRKTAVSDPFDVITEKTTMKNLESHYGKPDINQYGEYCWDNISFIGIKGVLNVSFSSDDKIKKVQWECISDDEDEQDRIIQKLRDICAKKAKEANAKSRKVGFSYHQFGEQISFEMYFG